MYVCTARYPSQVTLVHPRAHRRTISVGRVVCLPWGAGGPAGADGVESWTAVVGRQAGRCKVLVLDYGSVEVFMIEWLCEFGLFRRAASVQ